MPHSTTKRSRSPSGRDGSTTASPVLTSSSVRTTKRGVYSTRISPCMKPRAVASPVLPTTIVVHTSPDSLSHLEMPPVAAAGATSAAFLSFQEPEIEFHLSSDRKRSSVEPKDIANLMLWSIPCAIPLVEGPKWLYLKNKSRVTGVLTLYCNGFSYDQMMNTGAGMPVLIPAAEGGEAAAPLMWSETLGNAMLSPLRRASCWAFKNEISTAPVWVRSTNNRLEMELFYRMESHKVQKVNNQTVPSNQLEVGKSLAQIAQAIIARNSAPEGESSSRMQSTKHDGKGPAAHPNDNELTTTAVPPPPPLISDVALLKELSLTIKDHEDILRQMQFVLIPPVDEREQWSEFRDAASLEGEDTQRRKKHRTEQSPRVYAFDCEMVQVSNNVSALARLTLVDAHTEETVLDILVKPSEPVVDYLTRYSGITAEMLANVETTLVDAQRQLRQFIDKETFVVGHGLDNDFKACKMVPNCYILDTAHLFPHPAGLPLKNALRFLANHYLQRRIQNGEHDSCEDALAAAHLLQLKLKYGPSFGLGAKVNILNMIPHDTLANQPHQKPNSFAPPKSSREDGSQPIRVTTFDDAHTLRVVAGSATTNVVNAVNCTTDDDTVRKVCKHLSRVQREISSWEEHDPNSAPKGVAPPAFHVIWAQLHDCDVAIPANVEEEKEALERIRAVNKRVLDIIDKAPQRTLVNVLAANCREGNGNKFSKAHGILFSFIKDAKGKPPPSAEEGEAGGCAQS